MTLIYLHFIVFYKCRGPHLGPLMQFDHFLVKRDAAAFSVLCGHVPHHGIVLSTILTDNSSIMVF